MVLYVQAGTLWHIYICTKNLEVYNLNPISRNPTNNFNFAKLLQTKHRPFCDGSHRAEEIQEKRLDGKHDMWDPTSKNELRSKTILDSESDELDILESNEETNETTTS